MIRSNSKKAIENIKDYIVENFDPTNYGRECEEFEAFAEVAQFIRNVFRSEYGVDIRRMGEANAFAEWCAGLPSVLDTCYFYNRSAVADLAGILENTEEEAEKFTEQDAEKRLTWLIWREIAKVTE